MLHLRSFVLALPAVLLASSAFADEPKAAKTKTTMADLPESQPPSPDKITDDTGIEHLRGLEITLRPGYGSGGAKSPVSYTPSATVQMPDPGNVLNRSAAPYGGGFAGQAFLGYRFHPVVSAGLRGGLRNASAQSVSDGSSNVARSSWDAGFYARAYPLALTPSVRKLFDPWLGVGVEYMRDTQTFKRPLTAGGVTIPLDWTLDHHAVAVPLGVGVDFRVLPMVSLGPSFEYTIASGVAGCIQSEANVPGLAGTTYCSNSEPGKRVFKAETYGVWTAGLDLRATVF